jgi:hypothetical protein
VKIVDYVIKGLEDMAASEAVPGTSEGSVKTAPTRGGKRQSDDQVAGPSRRPFWVTAGLQAGASQDWATQKSSWPPRGRGGWMRGRGARRF